MAATNSPERLLTSTQKKYREKHAEILRNMVRNSDKFYADEEVTRAATRLGIDHPESLIKLLKNILLPNKTVWIEWFCRISVEEANGKSYPDAQEKSGCFIQEISENEYLITTVGVVNDKTGVTSSPISFLFRTDSLADNHPDTKILSNLTNFSEETLSQFPVGTAYSKLRNKVSSKVEHLKNLSSESNFEKIQTIIEIDAANLQQRKVEEFMKHCTIIITPFARKSLLEENKKSLSKLLINDIQETAGTFYFMVSLLSLMNSPEFVNSTPSKRDSKKPILVGGKIIPYMEHKIVKLIVPKQVAINGISKPGSYENQEPVRRQHEVMPFWCTSHKNDHLKCDHEFEFRTASKQVCKLCGTKKWKVKKHLRGDPNLGIITKDRILSMK